MGEHKIQQTARGQGSGLANSTHSRAEHRDWTYEAEFPSLSNLRSRNCQVRGQWLDFDLTAFPGRPLFQVLNVLECTLHLVSESYAYARLGNAHGGWTDSLQMSPCWNHVLAIRLHLVIFVSELPRHILKRNITLKAFHVTSKSQTQVKVMRGPYLHRLESPWCSF